MTNGVGYVDDASNAIDDLMGDAGELLESLEDGDITEAEFNEQMQDIKDEVASYERGVKGIMYAVESLDESKDDMINTISTSA